MRIIRMKYRPFAVHGQISETIRTDIFRSDIQIFFLSFPNYVTLIVLKHGSIIDGIFLYMLKVRNR